MDIRGKSSWHWAQTRVAQLVLFWGVLDLIIRAFDSLTKTDMLAMLRQSLGPDLSLLANPWLAFVMVALALAVLSERGPGKVQRRPQREESEAPPPKNKYSVVETAAIPFFLAFVCGVIFPAFESSYPKHPQIAQVRPGAPGFSSSAARLLPRRQKSTGLSAPAGNSVAVGRGQPLAQSLPELTPALDSSANASAVAGAQDTPVSLTLPSDLGTRAQSAPAPGREADQAASSEVATGAQTETRKRMEQAEKERNWRLLASVSESAIADHPQWATAYWYAGEAYTHLGDPGRAMERLAEAARQGPGNSAERRAVAQSEQLLRTLQQPATNSAQ